MCCKKDNNILYSQEDDFIIFFFYIKGEGRISLNIKFFIIQNLPQY